MLKRVDDDQIPPPTAELIGDPSQELAHVFWSSGTTGRPKGICWSQQTLWNIISSPQKMGKLMNINGLDKLNFSLFFGDKIFLSSDFVDVMTLHFFHVIGFLHVIVSLLQGWTTNFIPNQRFSPEILLQCIRDQKPNLLIIGSHHYVQLSEADKSSFLGFDPKGLESVKIIMPTGMFAKPIFKMGMKYVFLFCFS